MKKPMKNIDSLFQEKLQQHEVQPPADAWENIEERLHKKKKRRLIPIWLQLTGAAIVIGLLGLLSINYLKSDQTEIPQGPVISDSEQIKPIETTPVVEKNNFPQTEDSLESPKNVVASTEPISKVNKADSKTATSQSSTEQNNGSKFSSINIDNTNSKEQTVAVSSTKSNQQPTTSTSSNPQTPQTTNTLEEFEKKTELTSEKEPMSLIASITEEEKELDLVTEVNKAHKGWSVAPIVAPIFFDSFNNVGSPLDSQFENNAKQGSSTVSYGVKVNYAINNKWSFQSGVSIMNVGYRVEDIIVNPTAISSSLLNNVSYSPEAAIVNVNARQESAAAFRETSRTLGATGDLNQEFGYVEIPLEVKYRVTNGKFGIHLVAGFSSLILNNNDVFVSADSFTTDLGEANNLNSLNFSGNFGLDFDYLINRKLFINVAPMLKLQTNTFSATQNFEPYVIGVYTGINYKF